MSQTVKVAISLPAGLLEMAEHERQLRGESRSEFFRHALEAYLRQERQREQIARYIQGYREQPEGDEEVTAAELRSVGAFFRGALGVKRGEVWWANLPLPIGRRPVVLLSRDEAYTVRQLVMVAEVSTRVRHIPAEVALGPGDGLPRAGAANLDSITTIPRRSLQQHIATLSAEKLQAVNDALKFALGLDD